MSREIDARLIMLQQLASDAAIAPNIQTASRWLTESLPKNISDIERVVVWVFLRKILIRDFARELTREEKEFCKTKEEIESEL